MTGTTEKKDPPRTDAEWARDVQQRVENVEHPTALRAGDWVLSTDPDTGSLIGSHVSGGSVILATPPQTADPDAVATTDFLHLSVARIQPQTAPGGSGILVDWDSPVFTSSDWDMDLPDSDVVIPADGTYLCSYHLAWSTNSTSTGKAFFRIDNQVRMAHEYAPEGTWYQSMYMTETFNLSAGQVITAGAFSPSTRTFGPSGADPNVHTSLSLTRLPVRG